MSRRFAAGLGATLAVIVSLCDWAQLRAIAPPSTSPIGANAPAPTPTRAGTKDASEPRVLNDDGGWSWFQDERAIVSGHTLVFGSVASGRSGALRRGQVEATGVDLATGSVRRFTLSSTPVENGDAYDDHDAPSFVERSDGRILAAWTGHSKRNAFYYRVSTAPGEISSFGPERSFSPSATSRLTFANLHRIPGTPSILDFFRGLDGHAKPSVAYSDDDGETWRIGGVVLDVPTAVSHHPYVKYASDGRGAIHLVYSEGHPRDFDNSIYHVMIRDGLILDSLGRRLAAVSEGLPAPERGTRLYTGDPANVAWPADLEVDAAGRPVVAFSIQKNSGGLPPGQGGEDHRYALGHWNGERWEIEEVGFAGTRLYAGEDDYTGGITLTPGDTSVLVLSTNADPATGQPLVSIRDGQRHWEVFRGRRGDRGWSFEPITRNSAADNLRPLVPGGRRGHGGVLWLRGTYRAFTDYALEVVGLLP